MRQGCDLSLANLFAAWAWAVFSHLIAIQGRKGQYSRRIGYQESKPALQAGLLIAG
jgi:hypothetical protein